MDAELADGLNQYAPELIDGARVLWNTHGKAVHDETAFRHTLRTGHRLHQQDQRLTDAVIIDAYNVAQAYGGTTCDSDCRLCETVKL